jgi:predicted  nucleic acid-binding Zn-ribbon protein
MALAQSLRASLPTAEAVPGPLTGPRDTRLTLAIGGGLGALGLSVVLLPVIAPAASTFVLPVLGATLLAGAAAIPVLIRRRLDQPLTDLALALKGGDAALPHLERADAVGVLARAASDRLSADRQALSLDATVREIHGFAEAIQQMSHLFRRGHEDLSKHVAGARGAIEAATDEIAAGQKALAERVATIDAAALAMTRAGGSVASLAASLNEATDKAQREIARSGDLLANAASDMAQATRAGTERQQASLTESFRNLETLMAKSGDAVIIALHEAAGRVAQQGTMQVERLQAEFAGSDARVARVFSEGEAKLKQAAEGLDDAAGALAHRLWAAAEAQGVKAAAFDEPLAKLMTLAGDITAFREHLADTLERTERTVVATAGERAEMIRSFEARIDAVLEAVHGLDLRLSYEASSDGGVSVALKERLDGIAESVHALDLRLSYEANSDDGVPSALKERLDQLGEAVHSLDVRLAYEETGRQALPPEVARRLDAISAAIAAASPDRGPRAADTTEAGLAEKLDQILEAVHALDIRLSYEGMAEPSLPKTMNEKLDQMQGLIAGLSDRTGRRGTEEGGLPLLDLDRAAQGRTLVAMRLILKELKAETERLAGVVATAGTAADKLGALPAPVPPAPPAEEAMRASAPLFDAEKSGLQRMLFGFRLLLRDISLEAGRLREAVTTLDATAGQVGQAGASLQARPEPDARPLEDLLDRLNGVVAGLDEKVTTLAPQPHEPVGPSAAVADAPLFDAERTGMQRMLAGFRLLMRDIALETAEFRDAVRQIGAGAPGSAGTAGDPAESILSNLEARFGALDSRVADSLATLESRLAQPLTETADRIALGVAESLSLIEQRLAVPIAALQSAVATNAAALQAMQGEAAPATRAAAPTAPAPAAGLVSLDRAMNVFANTGDAIEMRLAALESRLERVTDALMAADGGAEAELADLAAAIASAAAELRRGASDVVSVGAALTGEIDALRTSIVAEIQPMRAQSITRRRRA